MSSDAAPDQQQNAYDLTNCDREPIHLLGRVQRHGVLLAVSRDWLICFASENCEALFAKPADQLVGRPLSEVLEPSLVRRLREQAGNLVGAGSSEFIDQVTLSGADRPQAISLRETGGYLLLEFEEAGAEDVAKKQAELVTAFINRLRGVQDVDSLIEQATRFVQNLAGFDRVMVYKFLIDGSGEVVSEVKPSDQDGYMGLRFPASDIPKQARALYLLNTIRCIGDSSDEGAAVIPVRGPSGDILDLSHAALRSVSPIHLEYLRNMGVAASMSITIRCEEKLWGLFACHHGEAKTVAPSTRVALDLFGQIFSLMLEKLLRQSLAEEETRIEALHKRLLSTLADQGPELEQFQAMAGEFQKLIASDGVAICVGDEMALNGATPTQEEMGPLLRFLNTTENSDIYRTHHLSEVYPQGADFPERAAGLLAVPISRHPRDYIIFFRREVTRIIRWAGDPKKPASLGPNGVRLTPRKSFEAYQQLVDQQCEPWTETEVRVAQGLRLTLLEVVLKLNDVVASERAKALEKQDLLISELNHRVRNLLGLVRGLVNQSKETHTTADALVAVLDDRLQALARAHDQITKLNWGPGSVKELIENEAAAYLQIKKKNVVIEGPDFHLAPQALSTLALVIHELVTNSAKYGALCDNNGRIDIGLREDAQGRMVLTWVESGGPPVQAPKRVGFGTTIIERSIPFDLKGEAKTTYPLSGVRAEFVIPASYVSPAEAGPPTLAVVGGGENDNADLTEILKRPLVVEDNLIIAMDAEDKLKELGAGDVAIAASVADALRSIEEAVPTVALLDVNLGDESSFAVADRLAELGAPYAFVTGYGEVSGAPEVHAAAPSLSKPYDGAGIEKLLQTLLRGR